MSYKNKNEFRNFVDLQVNFIYDIDEYLKQVEYRLFSSGLDISDVEELQDAINRLYKIDYDIKMSIQSLISNFKKEERLNDLIAYQKYLLRVIGNIGIRLTRILRTLRIEVGDYDLKSFIKDNSSLLHLVSTNNHSNQTIRKVSDDSYFYLCPFHRERRSSMMVKNNKNKLHCFGCGIDLNIFEYLEEFEDISYDDAIMLVAEINKIRVSNNKFNEDNELVRKYTNKDALRRFEARVLSGRKRAIYKNKTLNNLLAIEKFDQELDSIKRIRNNRYLEYPEGDIKKVLRLEVK